MGRDKNIKVNDTIRYRFKEMIDMNACISLKLSFGFTWNTALILVIQLFLYISKGFVNRGKDFFNTHVQK